ncbi:hypothetical protein ACPA9J_08255 [Pseudomonas aeruginosa]
MAAIRCRPTWCCSTRASRRLHLVLEVDAPGRAPAGMGGGLQRPRRAARRRSPERSCRRLPGRPAARCAGHSPTWQVFERFPEAGADRAVPPVVRPRAGGVAARRRPGAGAVSAGRTRHEPGRPASAAWPAGLAKVRAYLRRQA